MLVPWHGKLRALLMPLSSRLGGWARQTEMNTRKRTSLVNIVSSPDVSHG
jgi:hypothetical protein